MITASCGHKVGSVSMVTAMVTVGLLVFCFLAPLDGPGEVRHLVSLHNKLGGPEL